MNIFNLLFLLANFRSLITLSRVRALCPLRDDDSVELDDSDEPESDALESDEPVNMHIMLFICKYHIVKIRNLQQKCLLIEKESFWRMKIKISFLTGCRRT